MLLHNRFSAMAEDLRKTQGPQRLINPDADFSKIRVGQIADRHPDDAAALLAQLRAAAVIDIAQRFYGLLDLLACFGGNRWIVVQHHRYRAG